MTFTCERETDCKISYFKVKLIKENGGIIPNWYGKPTFSGRFVKFNSHHTVQQKKAIVYCLVDRAIKLSHPRFHADNMKLVKTSLKDNYYPIKFINIHISNRPHHIIDNNNAIVCDKSQPFDCDNNNQREKLIVHRYIKNLSYKLESILKRQQFRVIHRPCNKSDCFMTLGKDRIDTIDACGGVYKIDCKKCDLSYFGQTGRQLRVRVNEHKRSVKDNHATPALVEHD